MPITLETKIAFEDSNSVVNDVQVSELLQSLKKEFPHGAQSIAMTSYLNGQYGSMVLGRGFSINADLYKALAKDGFLKREQVGQSACPVYLYKIP